jgi:hypothetical protein
MPDYVPLAYINVRMRILAVFGRVHVPQGVPPRDSINLHNANFPEVRLTMREAGRERMLLYTV